MVKMKIKFVLESFKKETDDSGISIQHLKNMLSNVGNSGDTYLFKFVYPAEQMDRVKKMLDEFKDVLITASKTYQLDDTTGVLLFRTIPTQTAEKEIVETVNDILDNNDTFALLHIRNADELLAKFSGMKIKYFDKEEWVKSEELFGANEFEFSE